VGEEGDLHGFDNGVEGRELAEILGLVLLLHWRWLLLLLRLLLHW